MPENKPKIAQKQPYQVELDENRNYAWCACGRSADQPFCDGSHKGTGFRPIVFRPGKSGEHWLCGCKRSGDKPYCDGTHNLLGE